MPRRDAVTYEPCPGCDGRKLVASSFCRKCELNSRRGSKHPNWRGGKYTPCPGCGGQMYRGSAKCQQCRRIFIDDEHADAAERQRRFRRTEKGRHHVRAMNLRKFGLTPDDYDQKLQGQGGVCAACGQKETHRNQYGVVSLAVDHDHETGQIRDLLCARCNRALGLLGDSIQRLEGLLAYRKRW